MRISNWWVGDIVSAFSPKVDRGAGKVPTRRAARWLIGIGIFVTLVGAIGVAGETGNPLEHQHATVTGRYLSSLYSRSISSTGYNVRLRLENGDSKVVHHKPLYDAVGHRTELPVMVDVDPDTDLVDAIYLEGHRYGTGRQSAAVVVTILTTLLGVFLLLRGIGRLRRARLAATPGG